MNEGLDYTRLVDPLLPLFLFDDEATRYLCDVQKTQSIEANALISHTIRGNYLYNLLYASIVCLDSVTILLPQNMAYWSNMHHERVSFRNHRRFEHSTHVLKTLSATHDLLSDISCV
jgi:hypothetical protein